MTELTKFAFPGAGYLDIARIRKKIKGSARRKRKADKGEEPSKTEEISAPSSGPALADTAPPPEPAGDITGPAGDNLNLEADSGEVSPAAGDDESIEIIVFKAGGEDFAFRVSDVEEIAKFHGMTLVPGADPFVLGVCSLRGKVLPITDIGKKLTGAASKYPGRKARILVIRGPKGSIGVLVGTDMQFVALPRRALKERPAHLEEPASLYVEGVAPLTRGFVSIINTEKIFDFKAALEGR